MNFFILFFDSIAITLFFGFIPWLITSWQKSKVLAAFVFAIALAGLGIFFGLHQPYANIAIVLVTVSAGIYIARILPAQSLPMLIFLLAFSVFDLIQNLLFGIPANSISTPAAVMPTISFYTTLSLNLPWGHYNIGFEDCIIIGAIAEHARRRGWGLLKSFLPVAIGFVFAYLLVYLTPFRALPLIPFFTLGWIIVEY